MSISREALIKAIKQQVENYPDIEQLLAQGRLKYKAGWHEVHDDATFQLVKNHIIGLRKGNDGGCYLRLSKPSKKLRVLAASL